MKKGKIFGVQRQIGLTNLINDFTKSRRKEGHDSFAIDSCDLSFSRLDRTLEKYHSVQFKSSFTN